MQSRTATQTEQTAPASQAPEYKNDPELQEKIALRAYQIFEDSGRIPGRDLDNWLRAEQEVLSDSLDSDFG